MEVESFLGLNISEIQYLRKVPPLNFAVEQKPLADSHIIAIAAGLIDG